MKIITIIVIALGLAIGFTLLAMEDPGYVVLARSPYALRLPLALFVLLVAAGFAFLYLAINFIGAVFSAPSNWRKWQKRVKTKRAQLNTVEGYASLISGDWTQAERKLLAQLPYNNSPLLNYLGAAYAAQQQNNIRRRNEYLNEAAARFSQQWLAIGFIKSRLHIQAKEFSEARRELERLAKRSRKNVGVVRLLADVYLELNDWDALAKLLPELEKLKAFPPEELERRALITYEKYLSAPALRQGVRKYSLVAFQSLPAAKQKDARVLETYCRQLIRAGEMLLAEKTLRRALNRNCDARLVELYGRVVMESTDNQIKAANEWMKKYGARLELTLCLARLYHRAQNIERARELYLKTIAESDDNPENSETEIAARVELGALLERLGEIEAALVCYRQGMAAMAVPQDQDDAADGELVISQQHENPVRLN